MRIHIYIYVYVYSHALIDLKQMVCDIRVVICGSLDESAAQCLAFRPYPVNIGKFEIWPEVQVTAARSYKDW